MKLKGPQRLSSGSTTPISRRWDDNLMDWLMFDRDLAV
jgi:hypothetical protein